MATYVGYIDRLPGKKDLGIIISDQVPGMNVFFDVAAHKRTKGPGLSIKGSHVRFELGNGRAIKIERTGVRHKHSETFKHEHVREPPTG